LEKVPSVSLALPNTKAVDVGAEKNVGYSKLTLVRTTKRMTSKRYIYLLSRAPVVFISSKGKCYNRRKDREKAESCQESARIDIVRSRTRPKNSYRRTIHRGSTKPETCHSSVPEFVLIFPACALAVTLLLSGSLVVG